MEDQNPEGLESVQGNYRLESIRRCIQSLVHVCHCRDANCRQMSCHKMKRVVQHSKTCKKRVNGTCPLCKQLIALLCYHSKHCNSEGCVVPFCMDIRKHIAEGHQMNIIEKLMENLELEDNEARGGSTTSNARNSLLDGYHGAEYEITYGAAPFAKEWQTTVTSDLRNHLVEKLVKTQFPEPDTMHDPRFRDVLCFARKAESEMFEMANSREEYYHLVSDKIFKTEKELQDEMVVGETMSQEQFKTSHQK